MRTSKLIVRHVVMVAFFVVMAVGCSNGADNASQYSEKGDVPCGITPELKKMLKKYSTATEGRCGLWLVTSKKTKYDEKGYPYHPFGCVDKKGKVVIPLDYASGFEGYELIFVKNEDNKWGAFDVKGKALIPFVYDEVKWTKGDYSIVKQGEKYGILDSGGALVVPLQYDKVADFYQSYNTMYGNEKYCYEDVFYLTKSGITTVANLSRTIGSLSREHVDTPYDYRVIKRDGRYGFVNYLGSEITPQYQNAREGRFSEGLEAVVKNDKVGFIDKQGNVKIPFKFYYSEYQFNFYSSQFGVFSDGLAAMVKEAKWGFIDNNGNVIIPYEYDWVGCFHNGAAVVGKGNVRGMIDKHNKVILPFDFEIGVATGDVFVMRKDGKWGVYSPKGECITPCQFDQQITFFAGYATVVKNGKQGLLDEQNHLLIPCEYDYCLFEWQSGYVAVKRDGKWGIVDLNNQVIVPLEFDQVDVDRSRKDLFVVKKNGTLGLYDLCGNCTLN